MTTINNFTFVQILVCVLLVGYIIGLLHAKLILSPRPKKLVPLEGEAFVRNLKNVFGLSDEEIRVADDHIRLHGDRSFQERFPCATCGSKMWRWRYGGSLALPHRNKCSECENVVNFKAGPVK